MRPGQIPATPSWGSVATLVTSIFSILFFIALAIDAKADQIRFLDACFGFLGPVGAGLVAWLGVSQTVESTRRQELLKEWHANLRWSAELCASSEPERVAVGIAVLDSLDNLPFPGQDENQLIDAVLKEVADDFDRD